MKKILSYLLLLGSFFILACKGNLEEINITYVTEVYPLQAGKVFLYRLDSSVLNASYQAFVTKSYNAKDSVNIEFLDNTGRKSFRIYRYLRDTNNIQAWKYAATYYVTFDANTVEVMDNNNLRFVSLVNPVKENISWNGTQYINAVSPIEYYKDWFFSYQNVGSSFTTKKGVIANTYTVLQIDETNPAGPLTPTGFQLKSFSKEVYAKGIGLVYKEFLNYNYQSGSFDPQKSWGIKLNLIDYK